MLVRSIEIMVNFIVCEDNNIILNRNVDIINKTMFNNNIPYKIYKFLSYDSELKKVIKEQIENKIYILDIELGDISGIDISREIRKDDLNSFIIISTAHTEYLPYTIKSKLLIFDFVSKFDDYDNNLSRVITNILSSYRDTKKIIIQDKDKVIEIDFNDILKIKYNPQSKRTDITTKSNLYHVYKPMEVICKKLDRRFKRINDNSIINSDYILNK